MTPPPIPDKPAGPQPEPSAAIWRWDAPLHDPIAERRERLTPRVGGLVGMSVGAVAWLAGRPRTALVVGAIGLTFFVASFVAPLGALRAVQSGLARFGQWTGRVVGAIVLTPVFALFILPFGLLARRGARDPLKRRFERETTSYWKRREKPSNAERPF